jgi:hypothetical protein
MSNFCQKLNPGQDGLQHPLQLLTLTIAEGLLVDSTAVLVAVSRGSPLYCSHGHVMATLQQPYPQY